MQSITGVTDRLGADLFIQGSQGTGTGAGGSIIFQVAPAGSSGTAQNALATALTINSERNLVVRNGGFIRTDGAQPNSGIRIGGGGFNEPALAVEWVNGSSIAFSTGRSSAGNSWLAINSTSVFGWGNGTDLTTASPALDTILARDAANTLALRNGANAQAFRVYNTYTDATTFERANIFWDSNVLKIGTEKGSVGGTARALELQTDATSRLTLDTVGSARIVTALTVATLPGTPLAGMIARVTDATAPVIGMTVTGGGAAYALVNYNGANWTVIGV
jgi:hypothetical protein